MNDPFFSDAFLTMFRGELPDHGMRWDGTEFIDRYVGDGEEPFYYSLRLVKPLGRKALTELVAAEVALAKKRGRYFFEWKEFHLPPSEGLPEILERKGFGLARTSRLLYARPHSVPTIAAGVEVREVNDDATFDQLLDLNERAFGERSEWVDRSLRPEIKANPGQVRAFVAYVGGKPAASAWIKIYSRIGYLFGGGTVPELRGRGAYRSLVAARGKFAQSAGADFLLSECSPASEKVLRALQFQDGGVARQWVHAQI